MAGGDKIYTVGRVASGAIAASVMGVLEQYIDKLRPPPYVVTQHFQICHCEAQLMGAPL